MFKRAWAVFLALVLMMGALVAAPRPVQAALNEDDYQMAASQLNKYGLVQGDDRGYRFYAQITRAEMAKLLIYSLGQQSQANKYIGRGTFKDTNGHWAEGIVALAKVNGIMKGYPDGTFQPEGAVTYAEVLTVLCRLGGVSGSDLPWPRTYLGPAQEAGIVPDGLELYSRLDDPAARGDVFVLLWRTLTVVKNQKGENLLRTYLDHSAPVLTVDPQPTDTTDLTLTVTGTAQGADRVIVNGTAATLTFSYFQATVPLRLGPNTVRIQAVDDAGNMKEQVLQITRKQSPVSAIALTGPAKVATGDNATFTISLKDQNGQDMADHKGVEATVDPADLGSFDATTGVFTAATKPGTGTITVKAGPVQSSVNVAVVPGALDHLTVDPPVAALDGKQSAVFTAKGADKYGNEIALTGIQWTASAGTVSQTGVYVAPDKAGQYTVTATAAGKSATAQVQPPNYKAASVRISQPATNLKANGVSQLTLTATVLDASGNVVTDYVGNLTVASAQPGVAASLTQTVPVTGGVAQIAVRAGRLPGTATITALTNLVVSGSANVTVAPQRLQSVRLSGYSVPGAVAGNPTGYVEVVALDEDGYPLYQPLTQTMVVHVRLPSNANVATGGVPGTGPGGLLAWFTQNDAGEANVALQSLDPTTGDVRSRTYVNYTPGAGTMVIDGAVLAPMSWVQVQPGALNADQVGMPARVAIEPVADATAGTNQYVYVVIQDAAGYRVSRTAPLTGYSVQLKDQNGVIYTGTTNNTDIGLGRYRFTVNQRVAGSYTYTATLQPGGATDTETAKVVPGAVASVNLTATPDHIAADNASIATLRAELLDAFGNRVTDHPYRITFRKMTNSFAVQSFPDQSVTTNGGLAEVKVTAATVVATETFRATVDDLGVFDEATVTTAGAPDRLALGFGDNNGNSIAGDPQDNVGRAGQALIVTVDVIDRFGNAASTDSGRPIRLTVRNMQTGAEQVYGPVNTAGGRAIFSINRPEAATFALKATADGLTQSVTAGYGGLLADAVFQAAQALRVSVAPDLTVLRTGGGTSNWASIRAQLLDAGGNPIPNQTGRPVVVTLEIAPDASSVDLGTFRAGDSPTDPATRKRSIEIAPGATTSSSALFFSGSTAGSKTITWTAQDGSTGSFTITAVAPTPVATVEVVADTVTMEPWTNADSVLTGQTVTITMKDSNGNRMTDANGLVSLAPWSPDVRPVAVWNPIFGVWQTLDSIPGNGAGDYPPTIGTYSAVRGQIIFRVRSNHSGMQLYTVTYTPPASTGQAALTAQGNGMFMPTGPASIRLTPSKTTVLPGGDTVGITAAIVDQYGNVLTNVSGNVTFNLSRADQTTQSMATAQIVNGTALVTFTTVALTNNPSVPITVTAASTVRRASDDTPLAVTTPGLFVVTGHPQIAGITLIGNNPNVVDAGDQIQITFAGMMDGSSLMAGLAPGQTVNNPAASVRFFGGAPSMIYFQGLPTMISIQLLDNTLAPGLDVTFQIASVSLDATGTRLTIVLGAPQGGAPVVNCTVPANSTATVSSTAPVIDYYGNSAPGPWTLVPITGGF